MLARPPPTTLLPRSRLGVGRDVGASPLPLSGGGDEVVARDEAKLAMGLEAAEMDGEEGIVARVEAGEVVGDVGGDGAAARPARVPQLRQRLHDHLLVCRMGTAGGGCRRRRRRDGGHHFVLPPLLLFLFSRFAKIDIQTDYN